jgi:hypothetical protein
MVPLGPAYRELAVSVQMARSHFRYDFETPRDGTSPPCTSQESSDLNHSGENQSDTTVYSAFDDFVICNK